MYQAYNNDKYECRSPTSLLGQPQTCNFISLTNPNIIVPGLQNNEKVILPKGTTLYHATTVFPSENPWFEYVLPQNKKKGYVWFTSSLPHTGIHNYTHVLKYVLQDDLNLLFVQNLNMTGNDFVQRQARLLKDSTLDGYASCNECEIAVKNSSIKRALSPEFEIVATKDLKYID
jgi:hypothetical protein